MQEIKSSYNVTKAILIDTPIPTQTRTYKPLENAKLIDLTLEGIQKAGFVLDREFYSQARKGLQSNARFTINSVSDAEMQLMVGWQNSYDKSLSFKFAMGSQIFICENGCVRGDVGTIKRKHVGDVQIFAPEKIAEYILMAAENFQHIQEDRRRLKDVEITKRSTAEILGRMYLENEVITSTQLNIIKRELQSPTYDYNCKGSAWELYNFTTLALKTDHPADYIESHIKVHEFFTEKSGLISFAPIFPSLVDIEYEEVKEGEDNFDEFIEHRGEEIKAGLLVDILKPAQVAFNLESNTKLAEENIVEKDTILGEEDVPVIENLQEARELLRTFNNPSND